MKSAKFAGLVMVLLVGASMPASAASTRLDAASKDAARMVRCTLEPGGAIADRIDVRLGPAKGGGAPPIVAHAINTKGTGSFRTVSADHAINSKGTGASRQAGGAVGGSPVRASCGVSGMLVSGAEARSSDAPPVVLAEGGTAWSCSVSGTAARPVIQLALVVPASGGAAASSAEAGSMEASIMPRGQGPADGPRVACAAAAGAPGYDLALEKKL